MVDKFKVFGLIMVVFTMVSLANAQEIDSNSVQNAIAKIQMLKTGVLAVRLRGYEKQQDYLEESHSAERGEKLQKRIADEKEEFMEEFKAFSFCQVYFFYDFQQDQLVAGDPSILFDAYGNSPTSINTDEVLLLNPYQVRFENYGSGVSGMEVLTIEGKSIPSPFPYYVKKSVLTNQPLSKMVMVLNNQLSGFYGMSNEISSRDMFVLNKRSRNSPLRAARKLKRMNKRYNNYLRKVNPQQYSTTSNK